VVTETATTDEPYVTVSTTTTEEPEEEEVPEPTVEEQLTEMLANEGSATETHGPKNAEWEKKVDEAKVKDLFNSFIQQSVEENLPTSGSSSSKKTESAFKGIEVPVEKPPPVDLAISEMSRDGKIKVEFNQELKVPGFIKEAEDSGDKGRILLALSEIDVGRDIMDVQFISRNDDDRHDKSYYLELTEWSGKNLEVFVNFSDPLLVSTGDDGDSMVTKIKNPAMFVPTAPGGKPLDPANATSVKEVPAQLPKGVSEAELKAQAAASHQTMQTLAIIQLVAAVFMKGAINDLLQLFFTLQIICYQKIYDTPFPAHVGVYIDQFQKLIEFEILNPMEFVKTFMDFDIMGWILDQKAKIVHSHQENSIVRDLQIFLFIICTVVLTIICALLATKIRRCKKKITRKIRDVRKKYFFNGFIRSMEISYIQTCMTVGV